MTKILQYLAAVKLILHTCLSHPKAGMNHSICGLNMWVQGWLMEQMLNVRLDTKQVMLFPANLLAEKGEKPEVQQNTKLWLT